MTGPVRWWLVSDLHLDADAPDLRGLEQVLPSFVEDAVLARDDGGRHLVLLGDSFELVDRDDATPRTAGDRLEAVAGRFPRVFGALRRCLREGVSVHVVCGNHDLDLMRPAVHDRLRQLLAASADQAAGLRVHPWILYVPGLLYAEHGNQHHGLNRFPTALQAMAASDAHVAPPPLGAYGLVRARQGGRLTAAAEVTRAMFTSWQAERASRGPAYQALFDAVAPDIGMPADVLAGLHDVSRFRPATVALATAARLTARRLGGYDANRYLRRAARRIDHYLVRTERRPHCYVFGHTHVPALARLETPGPFFANTGTWSPYLHAPTPVATRHFPYVVVEEGGGHRSVRLETWHGDR